VNDKKKFEQIVFIVREGYHIDKISRVIETFGLIRDPLSMRVYSNVLSNR